MRKLIFQGIPSGDHECFCFAVDKETFIKFNKREPDKYDICPFHIDKYKLYPNKLFSGYSKSIEVLITIRST